MNGETVHDRYNHRGYRLCCPGLYSVPSPGAPLHNLSRVVLISKRCTDVCRTVGSVGLSPVGQRWCQQAIADNLRRRVDEMYLNVIKYLCLEIGFKNSMRCRQSSSIVLLILF